MNQLIQVYNLINQLCSLLRYRAIKLTRPSIDMAGTYHCKVCLYYNLIEKQWLGVIVYSSRSELTNWVGCPSLM